MAGVDRSLRYAGGFAPARRPTQTAVPVTFVNGRDGDICIWWTHLLYEQYRDDTPVQS